MFSYMCISTVIGVEEYGRMFFWLFEPPGGKKSDKPLVIWLNGGPGNVCWR